MTATIDFLAAASITGAFFAGMAPIFWTSIQKAWADRMGTDEDRLAVNTRELIGMMMLGAVLGGLVIDLGGARNALFAGSFAMAVGAAVLAGVRTLWAGRMSGWVIGAGGGFLLNASVNYMPAAFGVDSVAGDLNLGFIFVGLGYLAVRPVLGWLVSTVSFRHGMLLFAILCTIPAVLITIVPHDHLPEAPPRPHFLSVFTSPALWMAAVFALLFAPQVDAVRRWGRAYLLEIGYRSRTLTLLTAGFWIGYLVSRFTFGMILDPRFEDWLLMALVICAAATLGNLASGYDAGNGFVYLLLGFFYGPIFPTILGMVLSRFPSGRATAFGIVYAMGSLSTLFAAPLMAKTSGAKARPYIRMSMILLLLSWVPILALAFWRGQ